jgi:UDP-N-acetylmuramate--alanine ligase
VRIIPLDIGLIHFVGIGGIGMSGIAEILHNLGYAVQGSDVADSANVARLRDQGIAVHIGHREENLGNAKVVVISSAIRGHNPEVDAARARLIPVVRRAEMLAELVRLKWAIAVGGTHGKTTTTSLVSALLTAADMDPTIINGGIINAFGTNARLGAGDWMVVEADESDGTFMKLPATACIVTNIDPEHMEYYGSIEKLRDAFQIFVQNIPFYGFACLCIDHPEVQSLIARVTDRRIVTYGFNPQAEVRGINVNIGTAGACFDVEIQGRNGDESRRIDGIELPMFGEHNVLNALATVAVASRLKLPDDVVRKALSGFSGVKRRFTKTGEVNGITVIDDYGHHPVEIAAVLRAARHAVGDDGEGRVIAVVQPHRYSRLRDLFEDFCTCFNDAHHVIVADVYPAGESPIEGYGRDNLIDGLRRHGHRAVNALDSLKDLPTMIADTANPGDLVVFLGAGNITAWANALPEQLSAELSARSGAKGA